MKRQEGRSSSGEAGRRDLEKGKDRGGRMGQGCKEQC
jgi:hypothetical protein